MKKYISLFVITGLFFAIAPALAKAETRLPSITPERAAQMEAKAAELRAEYEAKTAEIRAEAEAKRAEYEAKAAELRTEAEAKRGEFETRVEEKRAQFETRKAEQEARVVARKQEAVKKQVNAVVKKLEGFIKRLNGEHTKVSDRVAKLSEKYDTTELENILGIARAKIDASGEKVKALSASFAEITITDQESFKNAVRDIHSKSVEAKESIREAHSALVDVVKAAKPGQLKEKTASDDEADEENDSDE